jgi:UDP-glucose 4-epimerase
VTGLVVVALNGSGDGFGIGADRSISMLDVVRNFGCSPSYIPSRRGNRRSAELVTSATKALGWSPKVDIQQYLSDFVTNHKKDKI